MKKIRYLWVALLIAILALMLVSRSLGYQPDWRVLVLLFSGFLVVATLDVWKSLGLTNRLGSVIFALAGVLALSLLLYMGSIFW